MKCDKCGKPATMHLTEIIDGQKIEKHFCEQCAVSEGLASKANVPLSQLLEDFVLQSSEEPSGDLECDVCGMTFSEFRKSGQLGCPNDYEAFDRQLATLIQRAQEGASQHVGKVPHRAGDKQKHHVAMLRLRSELRAAIADEDYERAAVLRDQIKELENT